MTLSVGWIVAIVLYVLAAVWVPVSIKASGDDVWDGGGLGGGVFLRYVFPVLLMIFWPLTLVGAVGSQISER